MNVIAAFASATTPITIVVIVVVVVAEIVLIVVIVEAIIIRCKMDNTAATRFRWWFQIQIFAAAVRAVLVVLFAGTRLSSWRRAEALPGSYLGLDRRRRLPLEGTVVVTVTS